MKKIITCIIIVVLTYIGAAQVKAAVITDPSQLSNTKVYTINTARGYLTLDLENVMLTSTTVRDADSESETYNQYVIENENADQSEEARQFGILNIDGKYYIYSPKLKQFGLLHNASVEFYSTAGTAFAFTQDGQDDGPLRLKIWGWGDDGTQCYYINNNGSIVLNKYTTVDPGNSLMIEEVPGATLDFDEAMEVFNSDMWIDSHHVYYIATNEARMGQWGIEEDGLTLVGTREGADASNPACSDDDRKWAFYRDGAKTYLFNVGMQMFLSKNTKSQARGGRTLETGQLTTSKDEFASVKFVLSNDENYPFVLYIEENGLWFNGQGSGSMTISTWRSAFDDGNRQSITEVPGEDAYDDMQAFFEIPSWDITYHLIFEGQEIGTVERNMTAGFDAKLPDDMIYSSCEYEYDPAIITSDEDVTVNVSWMGPFEFSSSYSSATWYNMLFDRENEGRDGRWYAYWEEGTEPYYPKKNADEATRSAPQCQWAFVGNPYQLQIYNKAAGDGVTLAFEVVNGANAAVLRPGEHFWAAMEYNPGPDVNVIDADEFSLATWKDGNLYRMNQVGGASASSYFGLWAGFDQGSGLTAEEVPGIDVTDVWYDVYYNDQVVASAKVIGQEIGAPIAEIPSELSRDYVELEYDESMDVTDGLRVPVTATWDGPFELAADFSSARWYDLAVRGNWYVTSNNVAENGALAPINEGLGLLDDAHQWAFVGDPWHVKLYNKAVGSGQVYGATGAEDGGGIPKFQSEDYYWKICRSKSNIEDAFTMNVAGTNLHVNQYGGAGYPLQFWNNGNNISDIGSAFTVFDVPTDFASFVEAEVTPYMESDSKWFSWTDAARSAIGYNASYKESCPYETYESMKLAITSLKDDVNNYLFPPTGYYRMQNRYYSDFFGYISEAPMADEVGTGASTVVKLTKVGDHKYTIQCQGEYLQALLRSQTMYTDPSYPVTFEAFVPEPGYGAFRALEEFDEDVEDFDYHFLHRRQEKDYVGWEKNSPASQYKLLDAETIAIEVGAEGMASLYVPFAVLSPEGLAAFTGKIEDDHVRMTGLKGIVPAATPVVILAEEGTYEMNVSQDASAPAEGNDLKGTYLQSSPSYALAPQSASADNMFFAPLGENLPANTAYVKLDDTSVTEIPMVFDDYTGIKGIEDSESHTLYDLSGRRVNKTTKGIYIVDGKKAVVR